MAIKPGKVSPKKTGRPRDSESVWISLASQPIPKESFGVCANYKSCQNFQAILGNGYCVECWDKGLPRPIPQTWEESFAKLLVYKEANGHCNVPSRTAQLGPWVNNQRGAYQKNKLLPEQIARLEAIGFVWSTPPPKKAQSNAS